MAKSIGFIVRVQSLNILEPGFEVFIAGSAGVRLSQNLPLKSSQPAVDFFQGNGIYFPLKYPELGVYCTIDLPNLPLTYHKLYLVVQDDNTKDSWNFNTIYYPLESIALHCGQGIKSFAPQFQEIIHPFLLSPSRSKPFSKEFLPNVQSAVDFDSLIAHCETIERRLVERAGWQFEKTWLKSRKKGDKAIQTVYRIRSVDQENWNLVIRGEEYEGIRTVDFLHPDIRDVNFDGIPDLRVQEGMGGHGRYFAFNQSSGGFEELFISNLQNLSIDYIRQEIEGDEWVFENGMAEPLYKIHYLLKGKHWNATTFSHHKLREPMLRWTGLEKSKSTYSEIQKGKRIDLFCERDSTRLDKFSYRICVTQLSHPLILLDDTVFSVDRDASGAALSFLGVKDFNGDNEPDLYVPRMSPRGTEVFYLSECQEGQIRYTKREGMTYIEQMMFCENLIYSNNKMTFQEFEDFNLDGWMDFRKYTQMGKSMGFWSYYLFHPATLRFEYSSDFSSLDYCYANAKSQELVAWKVELLPTGEEQIKRFVISNGDLVPKP